MIDYCCHGTLVLICLLKGNFVILLPIVDLGWPNIGVNSYLDVVEVVDNDTLNDESLLEQKRQFSPAKRGLATATSWYSCFVYPVRASVLNWRQLQKTPWLVLLLVDVLHQASKPSPTMTNICYKFQWQKGSNATNLYISRELTPRETWVVFGASGYNQVCLEGTLFCLQAIGC